MIRALAGCPSLRSCAAAIVFLVAVPAAELCALDTHHGAHSGDAALHHPAGEPSATDTVDSAPRPDHQDDSSPADSDLRCRQRCAAAGVIFALAAPAPVELSPGTVRCAPRAPADREPRPLDHVPIA